MNTWPDSYTSPPPPDGVVRIVLPDPNVLIGVELVLPTDRPHPAIRGLQMAVEQIHRGNPGVFVNVGSHLEGIDGERVHDELDLQPGVYRIVEPGA